MGRTASRAEIQRYNRQTKFNEDGCLIWTGRKGRGGYGRLELDDGSTIAAHRFVWEVVMGREIPEGMQIDHRHRCHTDAVAAGTCHGAGDEGCKHRACTNPQHLELVTASENTMRQSHYERNKTHCPAGHEYTDDNTFVRSGRRVCKTCERARDRRRRGAQT